jgi:monofunctional biosynthetic peptidoglycan transglycosylase
VRSLLKSVPLAFTGAVWCYLLVLPWPILIRWLDPGSTAFMDMRQADARAEDGDLEIRYTFVPLDEISRHLRRAVILAEDGRFDEHRGIDWVSLGEELDFDFDDDFSIFSLRDLRAAGDAIAYYVEHRDDVRGRSTITQQLAKNLYFSDDRSLLRKADELIVARRLELFLSKDRILELYLNVAEFGPGIFGAEAAARHYFNRSAADLTMDQAAALAGTLPHPLTSNPAYRPSRMNWRKAIILQRMYNTGG